MPSDTLHKYKPFGLIRVEERGNNCDEKEKHKDIIILNWIVTPYI